MKTAQEIFDTVLFGIREQGGPSMLPGSQLKSGVIVCAYRGEHGRKCAAGLCIADAYYEPRFEGNSLVLDSVNGLHRALRRALFLSGVPEEHLDLVAALQAAHDIELLSDKGLTADFPNWEKAMKGIAQTRQLVYTPPETSLTPLQLSVIKAYCGGIYSYATTLTQVKAVADTLFHFLVQEAADAGSPEEYDNMLDKAVQQIREVQGRD